MYKYLFTFARRGELINIYSFDDILLFPHSATNLFPRDEGIKEISYQELAENIRLARGLAKKMRITYLRFKRETQIENDRIIKKFQDQDDLE